MVISKTPFRMSFFGGGTDFPLFYNQYGGAVISATIDKYAYVNVRDLPSFFDYNNEIIYSKIEQVKNEKDIIHPLVRLAMEYYDIHNIRLTYDADLPARTGLGTSSSFAIGMLNVFNKLKKIDINKYKLANDAIYLERFLCNEKGGVQDQIAASFGGLNIITFLKKDELQENTNLYTKNYKTDDLSFLNYKIEKINISEDKLKSLNFSLLLYFTGISRNSFEVQEKTEKSLKDKTNELIEMKSLVYEAKNILESNSDNINEFGKLLNHTWELKRGLNNSISTSYIDELYSKALTNGALGGKLLGAGGGGFLLFFVPKEKRNIFREKFNFLLEVPFSFETQGTQIIYDNENF
ncbi:MAG: kinase [Eubacteriales bacterium]|nr:kinase [Eubacteriales bacterium]